MWRDIFGKPKSSYNQNIKFLVPYLYYYTSVICKDITIHSINNVKENEKEKKKKTHQIWNLEGWENKRKRIKRSHKSVKWLPPNCCWQRNCWIHTQIPSRLQRLVPLYHPLGGGILVREQGAFVPLESPCDALAAQRERKPPLWFSTWSPWIPLLWVAVSSHFGFSRNCWNHVVWNWKWWATNEAIIISQWSVEGRICCTSSWLCISRYTWAIGLWYSVQRGFCSCRYCWFWGLRSEWFKMVEPEALLPVVACLWSRTWP